MTRKEALAQAQEAARRAAYLAGEAERYAHGSDTHPRVTQLSAAGAVWADTSRAFTALADALTPTTTTTEQTEA